MRSRERPTQEVQLSPGDMSDEDWRKFCQRTRDQEIERTRASLDEKSEELRWETEILGLRAEMAAIATDYRSLGTQLRLFQVWVNYREARERSVDAHEASLSGAERQAYVSRVEKRRKENRMEIERVLAHIRTINEQRTSIDRALVAAGKRLRTRKRAWDQENEKQRRIGLEIKRRERRESRGLRSI
ncbi:uncharacterized protein BDZ99DRAFT_235517 [Mytilinidion resinicola]|uniref:Flagellar FliJ protein n=1 Tax=Mytilinidion resinicola TaxID=574789 RepID=A0A6A6Z234_9PEZI|nr:uncharacterized protein BDZ99DRAFT_235517 [Mytilinidion resinicola]KAF2814354.1 hypothetical protein BDZ99DRAFT_235517 [Mytilinidion resinicola]